MVLAGCGLESTSKYPAIAAGLASNPHDKCTSLTGGTKSNTVIWPNVKVCEHKLTLPFASVNFQSLINLVSPQLVFVILSSNVMLTPPHASTTAGGVVNFDLFAFCPGMSYNMPTVSPFTTSNS